MVDILLITYFASLIGLLFGIAFMAVHSVVMEWKYRKVEAKRSQFRLVSGGKR